MSNRKRGIYVPELDRLLREGGNENRWVFQGPRGYFVMHGAKGGDGLEVLAASGRVLSGDRKLSLENEQILHDAGFRRRTRADLFLRSVPAAHLDGLEAELDALAETLYGGVSRKMLTLGDAPSVSNDLVLTAMAHLAKERSMSARFGLYSLLTRSRLLLLTAQDGGPVSPLSIALEGGQPIFAAFTDWHSAKRYDARGPRCREVPGHLLFPMLSDLKPALLRINPRGETGGELYGHELLSITEAIARSHTRQG